MPERKKKQIGWYRQAIIDILKEDPECNYNYAIAKRIYIKLTKDIEIKERNRFESIKSYLHDVLKDMEKNGELKSHVEKATTSVIPKKRFILVKE